MAIVKNPKRNKNENKEKEAEAFISGATQVLPADESGQNKKPIMVRIDPNLLKCIDKGAKRLGISRSAFLVSSSAEKLDRMGMNDI